MRTLPYKWVALSNATLAVLLATLDGSITMIAMPDIFRGIHLDPLIPSNSFYLLWMILGYLVVTSVLIVSLGRLGDMVGRVKIYNLGFVIYTVASLLLAVDWMDGRAGATYLIVMRLVQGVGGACLLANAAAIIADAFPANQRGMALGINNIVGVSGTFIGLVLGGILAPIDWRLVFLISVPVGIFGTIWAYVALRELSTPRRAKVDWLGNVTFALGLILLMVAVTYGIRPYGSHAIGWGSPKVLALLAGAAASLVAFLVVESRVEDPMFRLPLFRIRAFTFGTLSTFLSAVSRGGLMFMLIIWLQGIWLPQHGYSFTETPLWAGIYMLPLTIGLLLAGPTSGILSDRFGARPFATSGMVLTAVGFGLLLLLPTDFRYPVFGAILFLIGASMGLFASPNRAAVMNSLPKADRGAGGAMNQTFQNSAQVLSIGVFFTLMIIGLSATLPHTLSAGLQQHGVDPATAHSVANLPPVSILFAAFLGYNPIQHLVGPHALGAISASDRSALTGPTFFPHLISGPFKDGLHAAFTFAIVACLVAAAASLLRGGRMVHEDEDEDDAAQDQELQRPEGAPCTSSGTASPRSASATATAR
ncbi:MFS transporter [Conexibacter woesei]|uniref:MFS transporter n=1 Tax=Conexibacter woesei TaxID=191495 RepID=UPI00041591EF|nr:MFS transporter [Conexibacter woesei]